MSLKPETILKRFEEKYCPEPNTGCWLWLAGTGGTNLRGENIYGRFLHTYAHRWAYEHFKGPIPEGMTVDHKCFQKMCVNPDHLQLLTRVGNIKRGNGGVYSARPKKTHCLRGHLLSKENTFIQKGKKKWRRCKLCEKFGEYNRKRKQGGLELLTYHQYEELK